MEIRTENNENFYRTKPVITEERTVSKPIKAFLAFFIGLLMIVSFIAIVSFFNISYFNSTNIIKNYQQVNSLVVSALKSAGYPAELGRTSIRLHASNGKIIAGAAQKRSRSSLLHQTTILVDPYTPSTFELLDAREDEIKLWQDRVTALKETNINNHTEIPAHITKTAPPNYIKPLTEKDGGDIFNRFAEILRRNVVSDKTNAYNKIFNLFLCKIVDEYENIDEEKKMK